MAAEPYRFDGEFVIDSVLGEGGMGKVFRARQVALDRWVALKVLSRAQDKTFIDRFYREARSAARLVHPNIIQIHTVGELQGIPYFAMEYIEGADMQNILSDAYDSSNALTVDEIGEIIRSVAKALAVAMEHGIVHRDIKPANIMVTRSGLVKVMDFGLAKNRSSDLGLTQSGLVVGTPSYMSPEQGASKPVDTRSDLYSLGCVMYECITGKLPFISDNVASLIYKHMYENPEPPNSLGRPVPPELEEICLKMLKKEPSERFQNPTEVLEQFSRVSLNSGAAEISLSKRATKIAEARQKIVAAAKVNLTSADFLGSAIPAALSPGNQVAPHQSLNIPPPPGPIIAPARPIPAAREPATPRADNSTGTTTKTGDEVRGATAHVFRADSATLANAKSSTRVYTSDTEPRKTISKIHVTFLKTPDGLWSYKPELPHCSFSEGLAALLPASPAPPDEKAGGLGDCLLCSNWSKRHGCVLGYSQELEAKNRLKGVKLIAEQAIAWCGAGRFEKAIAMLDNYIKSNPEDAEGFRELAFIYERPDYKGKDKRRSIVLYKRFLELARNSNLVSNVELSRIEERVTALSNSNSPPQKMPLSPNAGFTFQCFYRGPAASTSYVHGCAVQSEVVLARAGDVEPESGITSAQMGGALGLASTIFRRLKSDQARKDEQQLVKTELSRLNEMTPEELRKDPGFVLDLPLSQIGGVTMNVDQAVGTRCITVKNDQRVSHQLIFTEGNAFKAEQCNELLRRKAKNASKS